MRLTTRTVTAALLAVATAAIVAAAAAGAGDSGSTSKGGPYTIGISNGYYGNTARVQLQAEAKALAAQPKYKKLVKKLVINNAGTSVPAQISAVNQMIAQKVDAIILDSNSVTGLNPSIAAAKKAGIPVIAANDKVSSPLAYQVETVGAKFGATRWKLRQAAGWQGQHRHPARPSWQRSRRGRGGRLPQCPEEVPEHQSAEGDLRTVGRRACSEGDGRPARRSTTTSTASSPKAGCSRASCAHSWPRIAISCRCRHRRERLRMPGQAVQLAGPQGRASQHALWAYAVALKQAVDILEGKNVPEVHPRDLHRVEHGPVDQAVQPETLTEHLPAGFRPPSTACA